MRRSECCDQEGVRLGKFVSTPAPRDGAQRRHRAVHGHVGGQSSPAAVWNGLRVLRRPAGCAYILTSCG